MFTMIVLTSLQLSRTLYSHVDDQLASNQHFYAGWYTGTGMYVHVSPFDMIKTCHEINKMLFSKLWHMQIFDM